MNVMENIPNWDTGEQTKKTLNWRNQTCQIIMVLGNGYMWMFSPYYKCFQLERSISISDNYFPVYIFFRYCCCLWWWWWLVTFLSNFLYSCIWKIGTEFWVFLRSIFFANLTHQLTWTWSASLIFGSTLIIDATN